MEQAKEGKGRQQERRKRGRQEGTSERDEDYIEEARKGRKRDRREETSLQMRGRKGITKGRLKM